LLRAARDAFAEIGTIYGAVPPILMFFISLFACLFYNSGVATIPIVIVATFLGVALGRGLENWQRKRQSDSVPETVTRGSLASRTASQWRAASRLAPPDQVAAILRLEGLWSRYEGHLLDPLGLTAELDTCEEFIASAARRTPDYPLAVEQAPVPPFLAHLDWAIHAGETGMALEDWVLRDHDRLPKLDPFRDH
jgi:hypothetical protein